MSETQEKQVIGKVQEGTILQLNTLPSSSIADQPSDIHLAN